jgi:hypothetical protein
MTFQGLFLIGTLGYNEPAAGLVGLPGTVLLVLFSTRFGELAERFGPRLFMSLGPAIMGLGLLWLARVPAHSSPWMFGYEEVQSILPPADYFVDLLPATMVFGMGLMMMVAPLTATIMSSVPQHNAGVASAINNSISRVGAPLVTAIVFMAVVSTFYDKIEDDHPHLDTSSRKFRQTVSPLSAPEPGGDPQVVASVQEASAQAFHLAMIVSTSLLWLGAVVNGLGIRNPKKAPMAGEPAAAQTHVCCQGPTPALGRTAGTAVT